MTAVIFAEGAPGDLAVTLGALVPGVVEGLVGDAVIIARRPEPAMTSIAEIAGAKLVIAPEGDPWRAGAALARREWLLCLQAPDVPGEGWMRAVDRFLAGAGRSGQPLGRFSRRKAGPASVYVALADRVAGTRTARAGDVARREWLLAGDARRARPVRIEASIERVSA